MSLTLHPAEELLQGLAPRAELSAYSIEPLSFDDLKLDAGVVLHEARTVVPSGTHVLTVSEVRDAVTLYVDGERIGSSRGPRAEFTITGTGQFTSLTLVVESFGRINYGPKLGQDKGILGPVLLDRRIVQRWHSRAVAPDRWDAESLTLTSRRRGLPSDPGFASAHFNVTVPADTHIAIPGSERGLIWLNGFLLGRYWSIGPQQTLYCPAPLLLSGTNTITVLEHERLGSVVELRPHAILGPTENYVEEF